jgi:hypothetical protein
MNSDNSDANRHHQANDSTHSNGSPHAQSRKFAGRARAIFSAFPSNLDAQMKGSPYAALGIAFAIGMGAGVVLGSRILRSVLASAASYAAMEIGRAYLRQTVSGGGASAEQ